MPERIFAIVTPPNNSIYVFEGKLKIEVNAVFQFELASRFDKAYSALPQNLERILRDNKGRYWQIFDNGELVAKHSYKKNKEMYKSGHRVICYISQCPNTFAELAK